MKAVVSRVLSASVTVDGVVVGELPTAGLLVLLGITHTDDHVVAARMAEKIGGLRILVSPAGQDASARDLDAPILVVSQFTLYGDTRKGRRPSWSAAAPREVAEPLVDAVVDHLRRGGSTVATGEFGALMQVRSCNDGPFTILLDVEGDRSARP